MVSCHRNRRIDGRWCDVRTIACLSLMGWAVCSRPVSAADAATAPRPALVRVGRVDRQTLQAHWDAIGQLQEVRRALVAAEVPGRVVEVPVEEGDVVTGQETVLARIDDVWAQLELAASQARLQQSQASIVEAQALVERAQRDRQYLDELQKSGSAKPREVQDAHTIERARLAQLERARADLLAVQTQIDRTREQLARLTVLAPFDGVVVRKLTEAGQWVDQGDEVVQIVSRGSVDAVVHVPEAVINCVEIGTHVQLLIEPLDQEVVGRVVAINPLGSAAARTYPVKVRLDDQDGKLKPGMSMLARIPTSQRAQVLTVPRDAVHRSASGKVVWADLEGVAVPVAVEVLFGQGDRFAVKPIDAENHPDGPRLTEDVRVVVEGAERLSPGRPLVVAPQAASGS